MSTPRALVLVSLLHCFATGAGGAAIVVHADSILVEDLSPAMIGHGIEDVNHELIGGIYASAIFGESFEEPTGPGGISGAPGGSVHATWAAVAPVPAQCTFEVVTGSAFTGRQAQAITVSGAGAASPCGILNRGLGSGGLSFDSGTTYTVRFYAKALTGAAQPPITVSLVDMHAQNSIASAVVLLASADWRNYSVSLQVPSSFPGTTCTQDASPLVPCATNSDNACITCNGALSISLAAGVVAGIIIDQVSLMAMGGGRSPVDDLTATRQDVAALLSSGNGVNGIPAMGLTALRLGGSAILVDGYRWKVRSTSWDSRTTCMNDEIVTTPHTVYIDRTRCRRSAVRAMCDSLMKATGTSRRPQQRGASLNSLHFASTSTQLSASSQ